MCARVLAIVWLGHKLVCVTALVNEVEVVWIRSLLLVLVVVVVVVLVLLVVLVLVGLTLVVVVVVLVVVHVRSWPGLSLI